MILYVCIALLALTPLAAPAQPLRVAPEHDTDSPTARVEWDRQRLRDPQTDEIPQHARSNELRFVRGLALNGIPAKPIATSTGNMRLRSIGPRNVGGRTRALAFDRTNRSVMLAGGAAGGIWRSIDSGQSWLRVSDLDDLQNITSIVQSDLPVDGSVWYASTGELLSTTTRRTSTNLRTLGSGTGIYRSTDRGVTWRVLPGTEVTSEPNALGTPFSAVWKLERPRSESGEPSGGVLAACYGGIYSIGPGASPAIDQLIGDSTEPSLNTDVVSTKNGISYLATSSSDRGRKPQGYGIWRYDARTKEMRNITPVGFPQSARRIVMAAAPSDERMLYVFVDTPKDWESKYRSFDATITLMKYVDDGGTGRWTHLTEWLRGMSGFYTLAGYAMTIAVHPLDTNTVFIGGNNMLRTRSGFTDIREGDVIGGYIRYNEPGSLHPDMHGVVFDPENPERMFVACDGGVYSLEKSRATSTPRWTELNNGYVSTMAYAVSLDHSDDFVVAGFQDNFNWASWDSDPATPWQKLPGGDGCGNAVMPDRKAVFISSQYSWLQAVLFDEATKKFTVADISPKLRSQASNIAFITLVRLSPDNSYLYMPLGARLVRLPNPEGSVDVLVDHTDLWQELSGVASALPPESVVSAIAFSTQSPETQYVGTSKGTVHRLMTSSDRTVVTDVSDARFPRGAFVSSVDVDPRDDNHIIVSFSNYNVESIFVSTDAGATWTPFGLNLESDGVHAAWAPSVRAVRIVRVGDETAYLAATSVGLFSHIGRSTDVEWRQEGATTLGNAIVEAIDYRASDGRIALATQGAGIYIGETSSMLAAPQDQAGRYFSLAQNVPNPVTTSTTFEFNIPTTSEVELTLYDATGARVRELVRSNLAAGRHEITLGQEVIAGLSPGIYYYRLTSGAEVATRAMTLVR